MTENTSLTIYNLTCVLQAIFTILRFDHKKNNFYQPISVLTLNLLLYWYLLLYSCLHIIMRIFKNRKHKTISHFILYITLQVPFSQDNRHLLQSSLISTFTRSVFNANNDAILVHINNKSCTVRALIFRHPLYQ